MKVERPVLRYHGGKWMLAPWIISYFAPHRKYTEPMGGGGSVLMRKSRSYAEIYNDRWDTVVNVFQILRDPDLAAELQRRLYLTPFSRVEFEKCGELEVLGEVDPIEKARKTILRSFAGFGSGATNSNHATGFRASSDRSGTTPAHDWANYPLHIQSFVERLRGVVIENKDYREILERHDSIDALHFLDPPYVHATRKKLGKDEVYFYEFTDQDHIDMVKKIEQLKGMVIVCGYECPLYADIFKGWHMVKRKTFADGAASRIECLWINKKSQTLF